MKRWKSVLSSASMAAASLLGALLIGEGLVRVVKPKPRAQVVASKSNLKLIDGVPTWRQRGTEERLNEDCPDEAKKSENIVLVGDSIFFGSDLPAEATFGLGLQARLDKLGGARKRCVLNLAQPGFNFDAQYAVSKSYIQKYRPRIIYWEIWQSNIMAYAMLGDSAYALSRLSVGDDGYPSIFGLTEGLNRWLFTRSRLYAYATLALAPEDRRQTDVRIPWQRLADEKLPLLLDLARRADATLVFVFCPSLDRDFRGSLQDPYRGFAPVMDFARRHGIETVSLAQELIGTDYRRVRRDSCCHYNAQGHSLLARIFERLTLRLLGDSRRRASALKSVGA